MSFICEEKLNSISIDYVKQFVDEYFELIKVEENVYKSIKQRIRMDGIPCIFGGHLCAQALAAAEKTVPVDIYPHSLHSYFIKMASTNESVYYHVRVLKNNRSYMTRVVEAKQNNELVYYCTISFHVRETSSIEHQSVMPYVKQPEKLLNLVQIAQKYLKQHENGIAKLRPQVRKILHSTLFDNITHYQPFEARPVNPDIFFGFNEFCGENLYVWVKAKNILQNSSKIHRYLSAYFSDYTLLSVSDRQHVSHGYEPSMFFSLDHHIWFHEPDFKIDEWVLYENISPIAKKGRAFSEGKFWSRDGKLLISTAQESLNRTKKAVSKL
uniref:Acyl-CoA thioesterase II n=1 Tax=Rhabditophanes sp. KR3021 TaxID=114890 RepID=A0AC35TND9_9BILA